MELESITSKFSNKNKNLRIFITIFIAFALTLCKNLFKAINVYLRKESICCCTA